MAIKKSRDNSILNVDDFYTYLETGGKPAKSKTSSRKSSGFKEAAFGATDKATGLLNSAKSTLAKHKLITCICVMFVMVLICAYYLVFMPRDAATLFLFGTSKLEGVDCYHAELKIHEVRHLTSDQVAALSQEKDKAADVPVEWNKTIDKSGAVRYIICSADYSYNEGKGNITKEAFSDGENDYVLDNDVYIPYEAGEGADDGLLLAEINLERLLNVSDETLAAANFKKEWTEYKVGIGGDEAKIMIAELLALDPDAYRFENGEVVYVFHKLSKELKDIKVKNLEIYPADAAEDAAPLTTINFTLVVSDINNVKTRDVALPDESDDDVEIVTDEVALEERANPSEMTLSVADLEKQGITCYVVGKQIVAGKYKLTAPKGSGIVLCMKSSDGSKKFRYCSGYNYYKYDNLGKGKDVKLEDGDRILVSGKDFEVVISPKS